MPVIKEHWPTSTYTCKWLCTVFVKRNPPLIHNFGGIAQDKEGQKLTKSIICISVSDSVVNMLNLFGFDISNHFGDTEEWVQTYLKMKIALLYSEQ